ncbi:uncharacterized protein LOC129773453 [Toxorhynchites rutilus septentrionalis]|uniref:uncharacterized protein LOC129773453 n=1 Tax=Toxorhynchites rutilus septentrionalis TaxID=329112 RepID=UPI00247A8544|nr:uncharacterized protein LOC129773453 [Toxorhynchites rutilus septentrionalis]
MCMSATGQHLPPFFIFLRMRMHEALKKGASRGSKFSCNASGYMTVKIFNEWFDHFLEHVKPSEDSPALLIIDGHSSHTKNLAFTEKARANFVKVLVLPPHTSNKLQPLDVSFMAPFKTYYAQEVERFLQQNLGKVVSQYDVAELMKPAFIKAATTEIAENGQPGGEWDSPWTDETISGRNVIFQRLPRDADPSDTAGDDIRLCRECDRVTWPDRYHQTQFTRSGDD